MGRRGSGQSSGQHNQRVASRRVDWSLHSSEAVPGIARAGRLSDHWVTRSGLRSPQSAPRAFAHSIGFTDSTQGRSSA